MPKLNPKYASMEDLHAFERPTRSEVDLKAIEHNFRLLKKMAAAHTELLPVIKGDAYGHGMLQVAALLDHLGVRFFGVSDVEEGMTLRLAGFKQNILLFESTLPEDAPLIIEYNLTPTICTHQLAASLNALAKKQGKKVAVHVEVDTGMGRLGVWHTEAKEFIQELLARNHYLSVQGLFTHFPSAEHDRRFTQKQIENLYNVVMALDRDGHIVPFVHAANSMGLADYRTNILNLARPGLMLYGLYPHERLIPKLNLRPALSIKSKIMFVKKISQGRSISYGRTFVAPRNMTVATIAIGYKDGYARSLSNLARVLVAGKRCAVLGRVTMDQIMIDVTRVAKVNVGQEVVLLGSQGRQSITAEELASWAKTISYEIVTNLGNRLNRSFRYA